jgi:small conductance mechanosensitive channel
MKVLLVILISLLCQKIINIVIKNGFKYTVDSKLYPKGKRDQARRAKTLVSVTSAITTLAIWIVAALIIMGIYGLNVSSILVSAGFLGAALAFGAQSSIRDFVNGFCMIVENQYRIDDYVEFDSLRGRVENISIRTTVVRDEENKLHHVPNGSIVIATNLSMSDIKAHETLDFTSKMSIKEFENALKVIANEITASPDLHKYIKEGPKLHKLHKITKDTTSVIIEFKTTANKQDEATNAIWKLIEKHKIPLA